MIFKKKFTWKIIFDW